MRRRSNRAADLASEQMLRSYWAAVEALGAKDGKVTVGSQILMARLDMRQIDSAYAMACLQARIDQDLI